MLNVREIPVSGIARTGHAPESTLTALLHHSVQEYAARPAVRDSRSALTYAELDLRSDAVAAQLRAHDVGPENRVGIYLERSVDLVVAVLGVIKAGGVYVNVATTYPPARRRLMLRASGARVVLTTSDLVDAIPDVPTTLALDQLHQLDDPPELARPALTGSHAACVMFTSGSSGTPKAIVLEHANLVSFALNPVLPQLYSGDRVGQISSVSFDAFHFELWNTLAAGAELVVLPPVADLVAADFQRQMKRFGITAMLVPTMVVNHVIREDRDAFSSLRLLQVGGDVLLPWACRDLLAGRFVGQLYNLYGPSEITTACTAHQVTAADAASETIPIGRPLAGVKILVVGPDGQPVVPGQSGELLVSGPGVARGYLGAPALTAERFVTDPVPGVSGRYYRTGDLVRRRNDGVLVFVGRADDQVKIRGYRIEPGEIERALVRHAGVREAVVLSDGQGDGRRLIAFVVPEGSLSMKELRTHAEAELPPFMVPSSMLQVGRIPAGEHGKRDIAALRALLVGYQARAEAYVAPSGRTEEYLAGLWSELLGVEQIGALDDFFDLGGHSLLVFRMRRQIERDWGVALEHQIMWTTTGMGALAAVLDDALAAVGNERAQG